MQGFDPESCPIGEVLEPPYFFPAAAEPIGSDSPKDSDPFASEAWADYSRDLAHELAIPPRIMTLRSLARTFAHGHRALGSEHVGLYRVVKRLLNKQEKVSILDLGGGCGENYVAIARALGNRSGRIEHTIVENERNCEIGRANFPRASFVTTIDEERYDVATVIGTLQYIPDWRGMLQTLKARCDVLVIARTPLRLDGPSFPLRQAISPVSGPHAGRKAGVATLSVIGLDELKGEMHDWKMIEDRHVVDYSRHLSRLPSEFRNVAYRSMAWSRLI